MRPRGDPASRERRWQARLRVPPAHPAFEGHFPGDPVLPGVALLDAVLDAVRERLGPGAHVAELPSVRWRRQVRPGDELMLALHAADATWGPGTRVRLTFEILCGGERACDGVALVEGAHP